MSQLSAIEWTDHTYNPWWGCTKVSPGCTHCYADTLATRYGHSVWGPKADRRFFGDKHWTEPLKWNKAAEKAGTRARVFCASMADVFERHMLPNVQSQMNLARARLWAVIEQTPWLDWLLLTKRPENIREMVPVRWLQDVPTNVWYGTSVENQEHADLRIPELLKVPAAVRFLSAEPLLGPVDLGFLLRHRDEECWHCGDVLNGEAGRCVCGVIHDPLIHWVIAGGESGSRARQMDPNWARSLRDQCQDAGVAYFFKQWGGRTSKSGGRELDGRTWSEFPVSHASQDTLIYQ